MAYQYTRSHSRSSSTGLGSSISCLDGVPFKVGPKFKPPPRVFLPPELSETSRASQIVNDEYLFDTEEGVLRWAEAREAAKAEQERLETERVAKSIQGLSQPQDSDTSDSSAGDDSRSAGPFQSETTLPQQAPVPPQRPAFANMSNDILTPIHIVASKSVVVPPPELGPAANIDLAMFEQEDDPFDNVERQLINEMEELKSVLATSTTDTSANNSANTCDINNMCGSSAFDGSVPDQTVVASTTTQQVASNDKTVSSSPVPVFAPRTDHYEEGDYVELRVDYSKNTVAFSASDTPIPAAGGETSFSPRINPAASNIYKQVLPPIGASKSPGGLVKNDVPDTSTATAGVLPSADNNRLVNGVVNNYSRHSDTSSVAAVQENNIPMKTAQSNPNLSHSDPKVNCNKFPLSHSPPSRPSSGQLWNPFKPLPPTPDIMSTSLPTSSSDSVSSDLVSPSEFDPYASLSSEGQLFVRNLVSMGFCRPQVARAVHKHGTDEKQVVEYLCHVTKLSDKGFNPIHAETALNLFDNNDVKAERYLEMFLQLEELGFSGDRIKEALVRENMDRDKVLDYLTA